MKVRNHENKIFSRIIILISESFPYQLTTADLPAGFELETTTEDTLYELEQTWRTPLDSSNSTYLIIIDYNSSSAAKSTIQLSGLFGGGEVDIEGADRAINVSFFGIAISAQKGSYIATGSVFSNESEDVITLLEAQMVILPGKSGGIPGFTLIFSGLSIGILVVLHRKRIFVKK
jgi:hypothetical protein